MKVQLTSKQIEANRIVMQSDKNVIMFGGAIRGAKTFWLCIQLFFLCLRYPKSRWALIRASAPTIERNLIPSVQKVLSLGFIDFIQSMNTKKIVFKNGSEIIIMAESYNQDKELNRFRGLEINGAGIDEVNEIHEETFDKIIERSGSNNDSEAPIKILTTCNPSHGWVKDRFFDKWVNNTLPDKWHYIQAKITDNPYIPESYLQSLKENMPALEYARFVEGDWEVYKTENAFAYEYSPGKVETDNNLYNPNLPIYVSIDFNLNPFGAIFSHIFMDKGIEKVHVFDEVSIENGNIYKMVEVIKQRYGGKLLSMKITGDAMGRQRDISQRDNASLYDQLKRGLGVSSGQIKVKNNPSHENSRTDVNFFLRNYPEIKINTTNCKNLIKDLRVVQCDVYGKIIKRNRADLSQRADHLDCFRYLIHNYLNNWIKSNKSRLNLPLSNIYK